MNKTEKEDYPEVECEYCGTIFFGIVCPVCKHENYV
jgi:hypothetical protein